ncbi:MAG: SMI1/KNR4 family protein, partial [Pseudomonadales bacterium]|nr:SMI1/KNR4 family protein [Pseudomonadales bacterium]
SLVIQISNDIKQPNFIAIASDPFGNYYGFLKESNSKISNIYFWDHEKNGLIKCASSFDEFKSLLY